MSSDSDDVSMKTRDELRGTEAGRDPWAGVRLMRLHEEREFTGDDRTRPQSPAAGDDGRPR